ncbi:hypothetical protein [uncultured Parasphingorhabdus sp.]|uniref:hypothetical protein n=1 Tax=uncultured Parasphingorhabdus sp. TaxID=2709694 RepID=UPI002AA65EFB|nr:hypothetical protein [uncultured Parasphingorhabdus sp.]
MTPEDFSSINNFDVYAAFALTDKDLPAKLLRLLRSNDQIDPVVKELIADAIEREGGDNKSVEPRIEIKNIGQRKRANITYQLNLLRQKAETGRTIQRMMDEKGWTQTKAIKEILTKEMEESASPDPKEGERTYLDSHRYYKRMIKWTNDIGNMPFAAQGRITDNWPGSSAACEDFHFSVGMIPVRQKMMRKG